MYCDFNYDFPLSEQSGMALYPSESSSRVFLRPQKQWAADRTWVAVIREPTQNGVDSELSPWNGERYFFLNLVKKEIIVC